MRKNSSFTEQNQAQAFEDQDPSAVQRKQDHISLAFKAKIERGQLDSRFDYEPLLAAHPEAGSWPKYSFLGYELSAPFWVSSMTGGTAKAGHINKNLARLAGDMGFGMGLGSCRSLLSSREHFKDFNVRPYMAKPVPLLANLGIAQLEEVLALKQGDLVLRMLEDLQADGLIIHVNPFQEWLQPEGDRFRQAPLETIERCLELWPKIPIIVKEVGQGMGPKSLKALLQLPLAALDFAASGGTNFAKLEWLRNQTGQDRPGYEALAMQGHSAEAMVEMVNQLLPSLGDNRRCPWIIVSGGIRDFLDGYYCLSKLKLPAIYGQASGFLQYAQGEYQALYTYAQAQLRGLELAQAYLHLRD